MTDKEQINNLLKNQDKNFNENSTHENKQIIIHGVDVSRCSWCDYFGLTTPYCSINDDEDLACKDNPNCYFKQLARKTQECEELKRKVELMKDCPDCKVDEYKKALDEIEKVCLEDTYTFADGTQIRYDSLDEILNIINKVKGEGTCQ